MGMDYKTAGVDIEEMSRESDFYFLNIPFAKNAITL